MSSSARIPGYHSASPGTSVESAATATGGRQPPVRVTNDGGPATASVSAERTARDTPSGATLRADAGTGCAQHAPRQHSRRLVRTGPSSGSPLDRSDSAWGRAAIQIILVLATEAIDRSDQRLGGRPLVAETVVAETVDAEQTYATTLIDEAQTAVDAAIMNRTGNV